MVEGGRRVRRTSNTNNLLAEVVERFQFHRKKTWSDNPVVARIARDICEIELCEMWMLTQS